MTKQDSAVDRVAGQSTARAWLGALERTASIAKNPTLTFPTVLEELAQTYGSKPALLSKGQSLSYAEFIGLANQYARWALEENVSKGEVVGLLMANRPEYLAIWVGITSIGGIVALLNHQMLGLSLARSIDAVGAKHLIVGAERYENFNRAQCHLVSRPKIWLYADAMTGIPRIETEIEKYPKARLGRHERRPVTIDDLALYIYTSGTTGLPKPAKLRHHRIMQWTHWFSGIMGARPEDRMYDCLPMYHSVGGVVAPGSMLVCGGSVVVADAFSARGFWEEITNWDCTLFQYIGELCRYLLRAPPHSREANHRIRLVCGNGLRADIWNEFKDRFRIPQILEFYASTEGVVSLYNVEGRPGAIGRIPPFLRHSFPLELVKFDGEEEVPARNGQGFCIPCATNEVGEAIGRIRDDPTQFGSHFDGYTVQAETERKILRDAFETGDTWFRTGDLMRRDAAGFFYFVDRIGDTFRWKGENVSTSEVAGLLMEFPGVLEAAVYGVSIPHSDGRAGMAALVVDNRFDLSELQGYLDNRLPNYAQPVFLRICSTIDVTPTFKQMKVQLTSEGYNPAMTTDRIYLNDQKQHALISLDKKIFHEIELGQIRL